MTPQEQEKITKELLKNKKLQKAMRGVLAPLQQKGDSLTFSVEGEEDVTINFEDKNLF